MNESVSKSVEDLEKERDEWRQLAIDNSILADQAVAALGTVAAKVGTPPVTAKTYVDPAPAPPPAPPPPPLPAWNEFVQMNSREKARIREHYPEEYEEDNEKAYESYMQGLSMGSARGGSCRSTAPAPASPGIEGWYIGARALVPRGTASPADLTRAALQQNIGTGGPARPAAPVRPVVHGSGPSGAGKSRQLGGAVRK